MAKLFISDDFWGVIAPLPPTGAGAFEGRAATDPGPGGADRHPVRVVHRFAVELPAAGDGLQLGDVVLAMVA